MKTKMWLGMCSSNRPLHLNIFFSAGTCDSYCFEEIFLCNLYVQLQQPFCECGARSSWNEIPPIFYLCVCVHVCTTSVNWNIF